MAEIYYPNPGVTQRQHEYLLGRAYASGVSGHPEDQPVVYANGTGTREVRIRANRRAVVQGYGWENDAAEIVKTLTANSSGSTRTDLVVLRLDRATWTVTVQVLQGTPGAGAPTPSYDGDLTGPWELPLAEVTVASGATALASSTVKNRAWYVGSNGQIRCTSTTRPPGEAGRVAFETDTGRYIVSDGTNWTAITDDSGATSITLAPLWSAVINRIQRRGGTVVMALNVSRGGPINADAGAKVGQVPAGMEPTFEVPGVLQFESKPGLSVGVSVATSGGVFVKMPVSVPYVEGRPLVGSLTWHSA